MSKLIKLEGLKVHYPIRGGFFNTIQDYVKAVDGVSMEIEKGKTYGLVGESGSGKSTIGKSIIGLEKITEGKLFYEGEEINLNRVKRKSMYRKNVQMIFQDSMSSLNPKKRVLDLLSEPLKNFENFTPEQERKRVVELLEIVGMTEDNIVKYPHEFSGGQRQRLGVARAIATNPKLIIADEPVSALDLSVQAQVLNYMKKIQKQLGLSYIFISHDLGVVKHMCDHISIMYKGRFVETGDKKVIYSQPQHIYTKRLIAAIPDVNPLIRDEKRDFRVQIDKEYKELEKVYYDENGKVFDLELFDESNEHYVALKKGGK
ncbi:ATP-binding cassette domain-containing protein [Streptobacillus felis]|uniref:ABC transporter ATP-binding protein n=1 Tax=Streptobacillus felis TaxID=1384509 RepID=A0A7Z0PFS3_9FUSO|nr:ATP-binding cassette domain-containing protein [Streptobacillus felis]NYV27265.1 ABC transporter ATP-binding protein [Streptobacillus felis]